MPLDTRRDRLNLLTDEERAALDYCWPFWSRPNQLAPAGDWRVWMILAGRGFGKTRTGAEWVRSLVETGQARRIALVAATSADARDVMVEGESGLLAICPAWNMPRYEPSKRRLTWPNGAIATTYSADEPKRLRGPQHDAAWCDELCAWRYDEMAWDMLMFGLRLGANPQAVVTTTPRPTKLLKTILALPSTSTTRGSTYDNRANLAEAFYRDIVSRYEGTRIGRQELNAEILEDVEGSLWQMAMLDQFRVTDYPRDAEGATLLTRVVVGVDPNASNTENSDEMGIVVAGLATLSGIPHGYVLGDYSLRGTPKERGEAVIQAYRDFDADAIIPEINNGGDMVEYLIQSVVTSGMRPRILPVHASRGKLTRAEPVAALYEKGQIHHVGSFSTLEDEMCEWIPGKSSPNRMDALVWALTELFQLTEQPKAAAGTRVLPVSLNRFRR